MLRRKKRSRQGAALLRRPLALEDMRSLVVAALRFQASSPAPAAYSAAVLPPLADFCNGALFAPPGLRALRRPPCRTHPSRVRQAALQTRDPTEHVRQASRPSPSQSPSATSAPATTRLKRRDSRRRPRGGRHGAPASATPLANLLLPATKLPPQPAAVAMGFLQARSPRRACSQRRNGWGAYAPPFLPRKVSPRHFTSP
jgi:hypothetical protein